MCRVSSLPLCFATEAFKLKCCFKAHNPQLLIALLGFTVLAAATEKVHADIMYVSGIGNIVTGDAEPGFSGIAKISANGTIEITIAGGTEASAIAFDSTGNLYAAENGENFRRIQKYSSTGTDLGTFANLGSNSNVLSMAIDHLGNVYAADLSANTIQKFSPTGASLNTITSSQVLQPTSIAFDASGNLYVAQLGYYWIEKFSSTGVDLGAFASTGESNTNGAFSIAFDSGGNMYAAYVFTDTIEKFSPTGTDLGVFAKLQAGSNPTGIAFDSAGNLYASSFLGYVEKFSPTGADLGTFTSGLGTARNIAFTSDAGIPLGLPPAPASEPSTATVSLAGFQASGVLGYKYDGNEVIFGSSGVFALTISNPIGPLAHLLGGTAYAFCDELTQNFTSTPELYNVGFPTDGNDPANALVGEINSFKEILLSELFTKFLDPNWYLPGPHTATQIADAIAFHAAIEEIVHEGILSLADLSLLNLDSGFFQVDSAYLLDHNDPSQLLMDVKTRAQYYLDSLTGNDSTPRYQILQLTNPQYQDYLVAVAVPEVNSFCLAGVAAICLMRLHRRFR